MFIYCICTQYLAGAPFSLITVSIRRGMEVISLRHCWGGMEAQVSLTVTFSSSAFFGLLFLIFLLTIPHRFSMGFRSDEIAGQSSTPTPWSFNQLLVLLAVWAGSLGWLCILFFHKFFLPFNFLLTCLDTALCEHPASLAMNVCGYPPCEGCQWLSSGQLSDQQSSPWLCSLVNQTERPFWRLRKPLQVFWVDQLIGMSPYSNLLR